MLHRRHTVVQKFAGWLVVAGCLLFAPVAGATSPGPTDVVRNFYAQLLDVMQHSGTLGARGRYQKLEPIVLRMFDVPYWRGSRSGPPGRGYRQTRSTAPRKLTAAT